MLNCSEIVGWMAPAEIVAIKDLSEKVRPKTIVEIGSFLGKSASAWAEFLPESTVWCVDPWEGSMGYYGQIDIAALSPQPNSEELTAPIYSLFLRNTKDRTNVKHLRCRSTDLYSHWHGPQSDLVFIDGDHSEQSITDDLKVANYLTKGRGVICGHDYNNRLFPYLPKIINAFVEEHRALFYVYPNTSIFRIIAGQTAGSG